MLLVTINSLRWKTGDEQCLNSRDSSFDAFYYEDELRELALHEKIHYLGLQRKFRKDWETNRRELHWEHWNYEGHKLVAEVLATKIKEIFKTASIGLRYQPGHKEESVE